MLNMLANYTLLVLVTICVLCYGAPGMEILQKSSSGLDMISPSYVNISDFSYTVAVLVDIDLLGGGALIQQDWVLTAASVLRGFNASEISVRVGSNSPYEGGRVHSITTAIIHPKYATNSSYNLALLKLDSPIYPKIATKVTYIARIPYPDLGILGNTTGYGSTTSAEVNDDDDRLQLIEGWVHTTAYCQRIWSRPMSSLHICVFSYDSVPCYGDEGNPLTRCWNGTQCELLGIGTGIDECDSNKPYTFVDVGQFADWIRTNINQTIDDDDDYLIDA